ncbi:unnamed protein product [Danaus chrysippus]|uniref:(African queen) hypothetical protein n=1 Tax=Danaus chrysippus TaxID=151541 RepID=A0A8J2QFE1_9NEOP|nr:unnamed protein product [Danaus chrysippus]
MEDPVVSPKTSWKILKNAVVMSLAFMIHFTAYNGTANLQSSINAEAGLGTTSLAVVCAGFIISNMFLPIIVIKWLGTKWTISLSFLAYLPYFAAQMYPSFYTLIPAAFIMGIGGAPLWCAKSTYLSAAAEANTKTSNLRLEVLLVRFFGIFFMIYQLNQVWGNLISSLVLSSGDNLAAVTPINDSMIVQLCGANFMPSAHADEALQRQPPEKIRMISGIYLGCTVAASLLVAVGVDSIKSNKKDQNNANKSGIHLLATTLKLFIEPKHLMLASINVFVGMQQAFFGADFTAAYVSCSVGVGTVGFVMMSFGFANASGCVVMEQMAKTVGRLPLIIAAFIIHGSLMVTLLTFNLQPNQPAVMYVIASLWGFCDSIWAVQISAFYGIVFKGREEAAFSNVRLCESSGYIIAYIISPHLRTGVKTYILMVTMLVGVVLYIIVEFRERKANTSIKTPEPQEKTIDFDNKAFEYSK